VLGGGKRGFLPAPHRTVLRRELSAVVAIAEELLHLGGKSLTDVDVR
jgi:hypothetical protein